MGCTQSQHGAAGGKGGAGRRGRAAPAETPLPTTRTGRTSPGHVRRDSFGDGNSQGSFASQRSHGSGHSGGGASHHPAQGKASANPADLLAAKHSPRIAHGADPSHNRLSPKPGAANRGGGSVSRSGGGSRSAHAPAPQKKNAKFPEVVGEVALRLEAPLKMPDALRAELVREVETLAAVLGLTLEQFRSTVLDDYQYDSQGLQADPIHFLLCLAAEAEHGRITQQFIQRLLFTTALPPKESVNVRGGFVEGTGNADHFIIGPDESAVVAGGSGRDVFMFLPRKDPTGALRPHILTDFDPLEDLIDLRALPIYTYADIKITGYGHHHCQLTGPEFDVVLIGVTPQQLDPDLFLFPTFPEEASAPMFGGDGAVVVQPATPRSGRSASAFTADNPIVEAPTPTTELSGEDAQSTAAQVGGGGGGANINGNAGPPNTGSNSNSTSAGLPRCAAAAEAGVLMSHTVEVVEGKARRNSCYLTAPAPNGARYHRDASNRTPTPVVGDCSGSGSQAVTPGPSPTPSTPIPPSPGSGSGQYNTPGKGDGESEVETVVSVPVSVGRTATYVFFQPPFEVTAKRDRLEVFVILPLVSQVHTINNFQVGGGDVAGDKIDLRGLHTIGMHKVAVQEWTASAGGGMINESHAPTGTVVTCRGGKVVLPGVAPESINASHFIFLQAPKKKGRVLATSASADDVAEGSASKEHCLNADAFRSLVYWCLASPTKEGSGGLRPPGATPASSPRPVANSPRPSTVLETARHSPAPPDWLLPGLDLNLLGVESAISGSPTSRSSLTNNGDWVRKAQRAPEGKRVKRQIDRIMYAAFSKMFDVTYGKVFVTINERTLFNVRPRSVPRLAFNPHAGALLPPQVPSADGKPRYTIALDLDETLVYSRHLHQVHQLCIRHGVHDLMVLLKQHDCEVVMWSAADAETVNAVWTAVDPTGITSHVLPREAWQRDKHEQTKDVARLGRDLNYVLIIDNTPLAVSSSVDNAIVVRDYLGGEHPSDKKDELYKLMRILKTMFVKQAEVPAYLATCPELAQVAVRRNHTEILFNYMHHLQLQSY